MLLGTTAREVSGIKFLRQRVVDDISRRVVRRQRSGSTVGCSCHVPHGAASRRDFCTREFVGFSSGLSSWSNRAIIRRLRSARSRWG